MQSGDIWNMDPLNGLTNTIFHNLQNVYKIIIDWKMLVCGKNKVVYILVAFCSRNGLRLYAGGRSWPARTPATAPS